MRQVREEGGGLGVAAGVVLAVFDICVLVEGIAAPRLIAAARLIAAPRLNAGVRLIADVWKAPPDPVGNLSGQLLAHTFEQKVRKGNGAEHGQRDEQHTARA